MGVRARLTPRQKQTTSPTLIPPSQTVLTITPRVRRRVTASPPFFRRLGVYGKNPGQILTSNDFGPRNRLCLCRYTADRYPRAAYGISYVHYTRAGRSGRHSGPSTLRQAQFAQRRSQPSPTAANHCKPACPANRSSRFGSTPIQAAMRRSIRAILPLSGDHLQQSPRTTSRWVPRNTRDTAPSRATFRQRAGRGAREKTRLLDIRVRGGITATKLQGFLNGNQLNPAGPHIHRCFCPPLRQLAPADINGGR